MGRTLNTLQQVITKKSLNVLSKFTILCWATFIAILGSMQPMGQGLDTPADRMTLNLLSHASQGKSNFAMKPGHLVIYSWGYDEEIQFEGHIHC